MSSTKCPTCGKIKKPWFEHCWECTARENQKPKCEICDVDVPDGHTLCKEHWKEKMEHKKNLNQIEYVQKKKVTEYKEKFEGKYYFNSQKVKSKSELLICYFLTTNNILFQYEPQMIINGKTVRPDFVIDDKKGRAIILEHFGLDSEEYLKTRKRKEIDYAKFCKANPEFDFIYTDENDMFDIKENLGNKLNKTSLVQSLWK